LLGGRQAGIERQDLGRSAGHAAAAQLVRDVEDVAFGRQKYEHIPAPALADLVDRTGRCWIGEVFLAVVALWWTIANLDRVGADLRLR
jgi:hypothetical protein